MPCSQSACSKERRTETPVGLSSVKLCTVRAHVLRKEGLRPNRVLHRRISRRQSACSKERRTETFTLCFQWCGFRRQSACSKERRTETFAVDTKACLN